MTSFIKLHVARLNLVPFVALWTGIKKNSRALSQLAERTDLRPFWVQAGYTLLDLKKYTANFIFHLLLQVHFILTK